MPRIENSFVWTVLPNVKMSNCRRPFYRTTRSDTTNNMETQGGIKQPTLSTICKTGYKTERSPLVNTLDDHKNRKWEPCLSNLQSHTRQLITKSIREFLVLWTLSLSKAARNSSNLLHTRTQSQLILSWRTVEGVPSDKCIYATMPQERY